MVTLSPKCQPKLPVLNSFTWATTVWPLITNSTLLAWALNSARLIGHSVLRVLKEAMVESPSCRVGGHGVAGNRHARRRGLPRTAKKPSHIRRKSVKCDSFSRVRARSICAGLQDPNQTPRHPRAGPGCG